MCISLCSAQFRPLRRICPPSDRSVADELARVVERSLRLPGWPPGPVPRGALAALSARVHEEAPKISNRLPATRHLSVGKICPQRARFAAAGHGLGSGCGCGLQCWKPQSAIKAAEYGDSAVGTGKAFVPDSLIWARMTEAKKLLHSRVPFPLKIELKKASCLTTPPPFGTIMMLRCRVPQSCYKVMRLLEASGAASGFPQRRWEIWHF
ncbi:hypothetical protein GGX14DRAFT_407682 [Mycena pura]|uniref:Uncharacterized protein n=1 Tax=Mycena pura TaxID=153505 RepID=A0AAD6UQS3_9AGAR|nr:hypothetical protein GGX14DRAFT_407682 [Mycena pura]